MSFQSADETQPRLAPPDYRPLILRDRLVMDEEVDELGPMAPWRQFFAGGSNRLHFVRTGADSEPHFVESIDLDGRYEAFGPGYGQIYHNAYDAFWEADRRCGDSPGG